MGRNTGKPTSAPAAVVRKAVAEAAKGKGRGSADGRSRGRFLGLVAAVIVAGTLAVGFAWAERQYEHPTLLDSWQNAYGVYDCTTDSWMEPFTSRNNPAGIRSRGDGMIYIEPADDSVTGDRATLGVFLDAVGADLQDHQLTNPDGTILAEAGATCDGESAHLQVLRWASGDRTAPAEVANTDLRAMRFHGDQQVFAIALAPNGWAALPPTADQLATSN